MRNCVSGLITCKLLNSSQKGFMSSLIKLTFFFGWISVKFKVSWALEIESHDPSSHPKAIFRNKKDPNLFIYHSHSHTNTHASIIMRKNMKRNFLFSESCWTNFPQIFISFIKNSQWVKLRWDEMRWKRGGDGASNNTVKLGEVVEGKVLCDDNKAFILNAHACEHILHIITFRNMSRTHLNERERERKSDLAFQFRSTND